MLQQLCRVQLFTTQQLLASNVRKSFTMMLNLHSGNVAEQLENPSFSEAPADPYTYTSGRWLHRDQIQRNARFLKFDFPLLCQKAIDVSPGARTVLRYEKKEGGFNRVFILHMDNGVRVVARIPFSVAGPRRLTTHSEVATMAYVESHTNIPIPKVLDWSSDDKDPVGTEYIIMQCASGVQLHEVWPSMNSHQHMLVTKELAQAISKMANLKFSTYGSLYFGRAAAVQKHEINQSDGFIVGPHCGREYWDCLTTEKDYNCERRANRGPWATLEDYVAALLDAGRLRLPKDQPETNHCLGGHVRLSEISKAVTRELVGSPLIRNISGAMLLHPDLNKRKIFVSQDDPTRITAIIDWQSTCIEPTFVYANETPDFVTPLPDLSSIPEMDEELGAKTDDVQERERLKKDYWICRQTFEVVLRGYSPTLAAARTTDETLLRLFRYCHSSWRDGVEVLRQELIELSQRWSELGLPGSCPYQPSAEELTDHAREWEDFETTQKFKVFLMRTLDSNSDGWVPTESWKAAKEAHRAAFEHWMETVRESDDPEMTEARGLKLWPWNER